MKIDLHIQRTFYRCVFSAAARAVNGGAFQNEVATQTPQRLLRIV